MVGPDLIFSAIALVVTTGLLMRYGQVAMAGWAWRTLAAILIAAGADLGAIQARSPGPLVAGAAMALVMYIEPRRWYAIGAAFLATLIVSSVAYGWYLIEVTFLLAASPISLALGIVLLFLEVAAMVLIVGSAFEMIDAICSRRNDASLPPPPEQWPVVCLQIPTYNEPPELVIETIRSLAAMDYPALRIQVIDNNTDDESLWRPLEAECERLRAAGHHAQFVHLAPWPGYKAGALNWGLKHLDPEVEIVGVVDADYIVEPGWLRGTVPFFTDPKVAFVQTPQDYRAWESSAFYRACYVGFAYFFAVGMVSRARHNAIIFAGTMGLIRRSSLEGAGGWDEGIITEDAEVSLRVLAMGARCVYVPHSYGRGIMPLTYEGLRKQRFRWAFGGIQILRRHWRMLLYGRSRLTLGQRYDHFMGGLWWFNDSLTLGFTFFVAASALGAALGRPFVVQRFTGLGLVLPIVFLLLNLVRYLWALRATTGANVGLAMNALRVNLSLSWVVALACLRGMTQERGVFLRTPKFAGAAAIREIRLVWVEALIALTSAGLFVFVLARAGFAPVGLALAALLAWAVLIYGSAPGFALSDPSRAPMTEVLREKMALELSPTLGRIAGRTARASSIAVVVGILVLGAVTIGESDRPPAANVPFHEVPAGPLVANPVQPATPSPSPSSSGSPAASATPTPSAAPIATHTATATPAATATPVPTPDSTPSPGTLPSLGLPSLGPP
jgi:cellulose synthase/poly-beta-1,6-N-acetylglucosamine synthase-like glycosyltransferase